MSFVGFVAGGLGLAFVAVAVVGGVAKCATEERPENVSRTEKFANGTLKTGEELAVGVIKGAKETLEDPQVQESVRSGTKKGIELTEKTIKSVLQGYIQAMNKSDEKQQPSPEGP